MSTPGRAHCAASGRSTAHANPKVKHAALVGRRPRPLAPPSPCHVPTRPGWPSRTTLLLRRHPPWQPGQAETAAGGADRRSPRTRPRRMDQSSTGCSATSRRTGGPAAGLPRVIVELIGATRARSGLRVQAELDQDNYPLGVRSLTGNWPRCHCDVTTGTGSGTTPCCPPPHRPTGESTLSCGDPLVCRDNPAPFSCGRQPSTGTGLLDPCKPRVRLWRPRPPAQGTCSTWPGPFSSDSGSR